ncbi:MAG: 4'-phosphopantetheinyl transferase superfamily protein [Pseudomonadota bacterium]
MPDDPRPAVQLFVLDLDAPDAGGPGDLALLDAHESARAGRLRFEKHRLRFIASHAGLRRSLAAVTGQAPDEVRIIAAEHEKPHLADDAGWHFNLSHSGPLALVAASRAGPLGVDVEQLRELADRDTVARQVFCTEELEALAALAPDQKTRGFFRAWTCKEAVIKTTGEGFRADLKAFGVTLHPDHAVSFVRAPAPVSGASWGLAMVDVGPGAMAAVSMLVPGDDPSFDLVMASAHAVCSGPQG